MEIHITEFILICVAGASSVLLYLTLIGAFASFLKHTHKVDWVGMNWVVAALWPITAAIYFPSSYGFMLTKKFFTPADGGDKKRPPPLTKAVGLECWPHKTSWVFPIYVYCESLNRRLEPYTYTGAVEQAVYALVDAAVITNACAEDIINSLSLPPSLPKSQNVAARP